MRRAQTTDAETAGLVLGNVWKELAPLVDEARGLQLQVTRNPRLLSDPWNSAFTSWLQVFGREINAVQTVYIATEAGAKLSA